MKPNENKPTPKHGPACVCLDCEQRRANSPWEAPSVLAGNENHLADQVNPTPGSPAPSPVEGEQKDSGIKDAVSDNVNAVLQNALPAADVLQQSFPFTTQYCIWINNWLVCGTDRRYIADMIVEAIGAWRPSGGVMKRLQKKMEECSVSDRGGSPAISVSSQESESLRSLSAQLSEAKEKLRLAHGQFERMVKATMQTITERESLRTELASALEALREVLALCDTCPLCLANLEDEEHSSHCKVGLALKPVLSEQKKT